MDVDAAFAGDMALLATTSALLHYAFGLYGMLAVFVFLGLVENGASLWEQFHVRSARVWRTLDSRASHTNDRRKTLQHQQTRRFDRTREERARSDAWTESGANDEDEDSANNQLDQQQEMDTNNNPVSPTMDRRTQQLLAKLSIRDVASSSSSSAPPSASSTASTTSSSATSSPRPRLVDVNARAPVPFETDLFVGHVLFLVRTAPEDPHYVDHFAGKRRMFWIQVQGRFKRRPRGTVFLGGELPGRISLGLFTKSVALVIIGIIQSLVGKVYVSFGGRADEELPTVSFPLYQSVDQFMMTPEGETPPPLGRDDFGEAEQARARRRQTPLSQSGHVFDVGPTYSFHFHTMYVNLAQWTTANLPGLSDMHLTTFFDALPLRLVAYEAMAPAHSKHLQRHKRYLFNFEVSFDPRRGMDAGGGPAFSGTYRMWRSDSEQSLVSSTESTGTPASVGSGYDRSSCESFAAATAEDQAAIIDGLAAIDRENAKALQSLQLQYLYWIEELDLEMGLRRVQYVFRVRESCSEELQDETKELVDRLVVVSAYRLRMLGTKFRKLRRLVALQRLRFHARSRLNSYSIITDEGRHVTSCLERLLALARGEDDAFNEDNEARVLAFESVLYQVLTARTHLQLPHDGAALSTELTPASIGVNLSKRDRDTQGVAFESVVYRFYTDTVLRQEVMVLTTDALHFYRSQSSSPDKIVASERIIGVQATPVPLSGAVTSSSSVGSVDFAFALQINTFAEEIVVCVPTEHARNAWIRVILQQCCPHANVDRILDEPLVVCYTPTKALKPSNRVELNSRSLFPRFRNAVVGDQQDPVAMVSTALQSALRVHELGERADVMTILEFLNDASALRHINLTLLLARSHEERLAFFLNLYHVVLAHAMIANGFPRTKTQWEYFQTHMCYVVGRDFQHSAQPLSMSLAEIEHVILRARLPPATELPHLRLDQLPPEYATRLMPLGIAHPDFRVSFALLMNRSSGNHVPVFHAETLHDELNAIVKTYIGQHLFIDRARKTIFLPRICEWLKHDYGGGGSPLYCVRKLLGFMDDGVQQDALVVLDSPTLVHIKYGAFQYTTRTTLRLATSASDAQSPREEEVREVT